ncbi:hypothetical protein THS27_20495 [Thalassospira sp. MCCC 1A01428]|nr:hypothetical protein THS27_20495 [Thalassospira sp. MCCC 1A01428]
MPAGTNNTKPYYRGKKVTMLKQNDLPNILFPALSSAFELILKYLRPHLIVAVSLKINPGKTTAQSSNHQIYIKNSMQLSPNVGNPPSKAPLIDVPRNNMGPDFLKFVNFEIVVQRT